MDDASPGPLGDKCHGPSFQRGCCWYSSCSTRSLPGLVSSSRPAALSTTEASAPCPAVPVTANASLEMASPSMSSQPSAPAGSPGTTTSGYRADPSGGTPRALKVSVTEASEPLGC